MLFLLWACSGDPDTGPTDSAPPDDSASPTDTQPDSDPPVDDTDTGAPDTEAPDTDDGDTGAWTCDELRTYDGDLYLQTNSQVETFCDSYNHVTGDLTFHFGDPDEPILQLDGARCLCEVGGDLELFYAPAVPDDDTAAPKGPPPPHVSTDFELVHVQRIGGDLYVHHIPGVTNMQTFTQLQSVGGDIRVETNDALTTVVFTGLEELGGSFELLDLSELVTVGMPRVETVPGNLLVGAAEDQTWHYALATVDLGGVKTIGGDLALRGLPVLEQLQLPQLETVTGSVTVEASCATQLDLHSLASTGALTLAGLCGIDKLTGLSALATVVGDLTLTGNSLLDQSELDDFASGLEIGGTSTLLGSEQGDCDGYWRGVWFRKSTCE